MRDKNRAILEGAALIAERTCADAIIIAAVLPEESEYLRQAVGDSRRVITAMAHEPGTVHQVERDVVMLPSVRLRRRGRAKVALLEGLAAGLLKPGERVIVVSGDGVDGEPALDTIAVVELENDAHVLGGENDAPLTALREVGDPGAFDALLGLCVALGHEGREGKPVGLLATFGDHDRVLEHSHALVLNPFEGHDDEHLGVMSPGARRAVREFSGMDGAFVFRADGVVVAAGRYLEDVAEEQAVPPGLGTRHRAAAGVTSATNCIAFCVSESSGETRVFAGGRLLMTIERTD